MKRKEFGSFYWRKDTGALHLSYAIRGIRQRPKFAVPKTGSAAEQKLLERRARLRLNQIEVELEKGTFFDSDDCPEGLYLREQFPLFRQMADFYWDKQESGKKYIREDPACYASERSKLDKVVAHFGDMRADKITRTQVKLFRKKCHGTIGRNGKVWGNRYINTLVDKIGQVYRCCITQEHWTFDQATQVEQFRYGNIDLCVELDNPRHGLPRLPEQVQERVIPTVDQFRDFLMLLPSPLMCAAIIGAHTGLRKRNVFNLRVGDLDCERGLIIIKEHKGVPPLVLMMHDDLQAILPALCAGRDPGDLIVCKPDGSGYRDFRGSWNPAAESAGIAGFTFRDCRNMYGSWMAGLGVEMGIVQRILGHTTVNTTARHYNKAQMAHAKVVSMQPKLLCRDGARDKTRDTSVTKTGSRGYIRVQKGA